MFTRPVLPLVAFLISCAPESSTQVAGTVEAVEQEFWFEERAATSGLVFRHWVARERHFYMPETVTGGVGLLDFDADGLLDVYLVQGGDLDEVGSSLCANQLFRNEGGGRFRDVTKAAGVGDTSYGIGCTVGDYDADGDPDLYVTNVGPNVLYRNNGDGTFTDVSLAAGVANAGFGSSSAFGDLDGDGDLDLFVVNYIQWSKATEVECRLGNGAREYCSPASYQSSAPDVLYENLGNGTFTDASERAGLREATGNGLGVALDDFNSDGALDVYVTNDANPNHLWVNDGKGHFVNRADAWGCSVNMSGTAEAGMGVCIGDCDQDGDPDLFMTHLRAETNTFYENRGNYFKDVTLLTGLSAPSRDFTGFGVGFGDFDHDGQLDIYVANGRVKFDMRTFSEKDIYAEPNQLYRGLGGGKFQEVMPRGGTANAESRTSRGAAFGDLDNDGDLDLVVANAQGNAELLINEAGARGNWIQFRVLNQVGGYALGAKLSIEVGGGRQVQTVRRAYSYCASSDPRVHFGLGEHEAVSTLRITWPDGEDTEHGPFEAGQFHEVQR